MMFARVLFILLIVCALTASLPAYVCAAQDYGFGNSVSDATLPLLALGEAVICLDKDGGVEMAARTGVAVTLSVGIAKGVKRSIDSSFPSGHASAVFAMATALTEIKPKYKTAAYGAAAMIAWSRVEAGYHKWRDVAAGAALGYVVSKKLVHKRIEVSPGGVGYRIPF